MVVNDKRKSDEVTSSMLTGVGSNGCLRVGLRDIGRRSRVIEGAKVVMQVRVIVSLVGLCMVL